MLEDESVNARFHFGQTAPMLMKFVSQKGNKIFRRHFVFVWNVGGLFRLQ